MVPTCDKNQCSKGLVYFWVQDVGVTKQNQSGEMFRQNLSKHFKDSPQQVLSVLLPCFVAMQCPLGFEELANSKLVVHEREREVK